jgi:hypothetical protein
MMKTFAFCPISDKKTDEQVARVNAGLTLLFILGFIFTSQIWLIGLLALDFLIRGLERSGYSPVFFTSKAISELIGLNQKPINAGPKIFAARLGFIFSILIVLTWMLNMHVFSLSIAGLLALLSFLEVAFSWCMACEIYPVLYWWLYKKDSSKTV